MDARVGNRAWQEHIKQQHCRDSGYNHALRRTAETAGAAQTYCQHLLIGNPSNVTVVNAQARQSRHSPSTVPAR